jgi:vitamin B12 transporter
LAVSALPSLLILWSLAGSPSVPPAGRSLASALPDSGAEALPVYFLPPVRTTATRIPPPRPFPGSRTVLDREWLTRRDPESLAEALLPVAGLRITDGGDGMTRTVSFRGLGSERAAVLLDGEPLNTAQGGGVDLAAIPLENVDRVEIARGAMGALYGPYALGGAVRIFRRTDRSPLPTLRLSLGTDDRASLSALAGGAWGRWTAEGSGRVETASPDLEGTSAHGDGWNLRGRLAHHPSWASALEVSAAGRADERDVPGSRDFPTPSASRRDQEGEGRVSARGIALGAIPGVFAIDAGVSEITRRYRDEGNPLGAIADRHRNRRESASATWSDGGSAGTVEFRGEVAREDLRSTTDGDRSRDRGAVGAVADRRWGKTSVSSGVRLDALEGFAARGTVRGGVSRVLWGEAEGSQWIALRADVGTSFRPPTFDDLFWPARAGAAGSPDLRPERALDVDLGVEARRGATRGSATVFRSEVRDLIQWNPGPDGIWRPHNLGKARIRGLEVEGILEGGALPFPTRIEGAGTLLDAIDAGGDPTTGGKALVARPRWTAFAEAGWDVGRWTLVAGGRGTGRVPLTAANTKWTDPYVLVHARAEWRASPALRITLEGRNLLDTDYEDIRGYAVPGREFLVGVRVQPQEGSR